MCLLLRQRTVSNNIEAHFGCVWHYVARNHRPSRFQLVSLVILDYVFLESLLLIINYFNNFLLPALDIEF